MPRATSGCKSTSSGCRSATSRSGCCRDHPRQAVDDDVPPVLHLGRLVHDDRRVHDPSRDGDADALALHGQPDRGHRGAVLPGARRRPLLRHRESAGRAPPGRGCGDVRRAPGHGRTARVHLAAVVVQLVLHAHARSRQQPGVPSHPVTGDAVPLDPGVRHHRLDHRRGVHQPRARSADGPHPGADGDADLRHRHRQRVARAVQFHAAPHAAARGRTTGFPAEHRRPRCPDAARRPRLLRVHRRLLLLCIPLAAYYNFTQIFLGSAGVTKIAATQTLGQISETGFMLLMPLMFARLGVKRMLMAGMAAWVLRYALFAIAAPGAVFWLIALGILLHGVCYDFFFVTGQIYVDKKSTPAVRGQAQGFLVLVTYGIGMLIGAQVAGNVYNRMLGGAAGLTLDRWPGFWVLPAGFAAVVLLLFALLFRPGGARAPAPVAAD